MACRMHPVQAGRHACKKGFFLFLPVIMLALFSGCSSNSTAGRSWTQGVYAEFGSFTATSIKLLKQNDTSLLLAVYPTGSTYGMQIGSPELADALNQAAAGGVSVKLWPMLAVNDGVWPDEDNVDLFAQEVTGLLDWLDTQNITHGWLIFDLEPPYALTMSMTTAAQAGGVFSAISTLVSSMSPTAFRYALTKFSDLVSAVHARGWKVECVTYPLVLDDLYDGNSGMQMLFHIPVIGIPWDRVSFMVYQSSFRALLGASFGPPLVSSYAADARRLYGDDAAVALGVIGTDPISGAQGYTDTAGLFDDIGAALGRNIRHIEIYSLNEILEQPDPSSWLDTSSISPANIPLSSDVQSARTMIQGFARGLNTSRYAPVK